jgi:hypothetical protein
VAITKQRGAPQWELDPDARKGFTTSVRNNQTLLALEYADVLFDQQVAEIEALKAEVASLKATVADLARMATTRKPAARADKDVEETVG